MDQVTSEPSLGSAVPAEGRKVLHLKGTMDLINMDQQEAGDYLWESARSREIEYEFG